MASSAGCKLMTTIWRCMSVNSFNFDAFSESLQHFMVLFLDFIDHPYVKEVRICWTLWWLIGLVAPYRDMCIPIARLILLICQVSCLKTGARWVGGDRDNSSVFHTPSYSTAHSDDDRDPVYMVSVIWPEANAEKLRLSKYQNLSRKTENESNLFPGRGMSACHTQHHHVHRNASFL